MDKYLEPTYFIDSDSDLVQTTASDLVSSLVDIKQKAIKLFYWTRDKIKYDAYSLSSLKRQYKASKIIQEKKGWCVQKAIVLTALARAVGIPARLHFADIRNYQTPDKLKTTIGTDIFLYHGYTDFYLNGKWVKATPAFNKELCEKFGYNAVEFDGIHDAILPEKTLKDERYVEYLMDRGTNHDLPFKEIFKTFYEKYPMNKI
jgi:transglutaminase-like putative cysteine protease